MNATDLLAELQSIVSVPDSTIAKAMNSNVTTRNNAEFKRLAQAWSDGDYDEDPDQLVREIDAVL